MSADGLGALATVIMIDIVMSGDNAVIIGMAAEAAAAASPPGASAGDGVDLPGAAGAAPKTMRQALTSIIIADVSMSLDNVLAVAGAAREHVEVLVIGLVLSIALMGLAASFIARLLNKHRWIAYVGLVVILYVAIEMIWRGADEVWPVVSAAVQ